MVMFCRTTIPDKMGAEHIPARVYLISWRRERVKYLIELVMIELNSAW